MSSNSNNPGTSVSVRAYHVLNIDGHSRTLAGLGAHRSADPRYLESCPFRAGEHTWRIHYYPMGTGRRNYIDYSAVFLVLLDGEDDVMAEVTFRLVDQDLKKTLPSYTRTTSVLNMTQRRSIGYEDFIRREDLQESGLVKDDCFAIRVDVRIVISSESTVLIKPLSDMNIHLGDLLTSNKGADIEFHVSGQTFVAHRLVLRARSPVFKEQLPPPMTKEAVAATTNAAIVEKIDDMEPRVFKALLNFIYTDGWPKMEHEDEFAMAQGLLVAAGRYGMQRLKLMCENWLRDHIDTASVSTTLALSEKQCCADLKEACLDFICSSTVRFAINETEGFEHLAQSCPHIAKELIVDVVNRDRDKGKHSTRWNQGNNDDELNVIKTSNNVTRADCEDSSSPLLYLFSGFIISIIVNSYIGA